MKKIFKTLSLLIIALALMLVPFGFLKSNNTAYATFNDTLNQELTFEENAMFVTYAGETLVGVDKDGYFYKMTDNEFYKTGYKFAITLKAFTTNGAWYKGSNNYIAYGNNTLVVAGYDGTNTILYYSLDTGVTWENVTLGTATDVGYPISIISGNGKFALMTAKVDSNGKYTSSNIYASTNGSSWDLKIAGIGLDYQFSFSNGYFFRTEYFSDINPVIYYSINLTDWNSFVSPVDSIISSSLCTNPQISIVYTNGVFCLTGFNEVHTTTSLTGSWKQVENPIHDFFKIENIYKAVPYQNGAIFCTETALWYADVTLDGLANVEALVGSKSDISVDQSGYNSIYGNTIAESTKQLLVGFNNFYGQLEAFNPDGLYNIAHFKIYDKTIKHNVTFQDWNGNIISSIEVVDGEVVVSPTNPTREGYTFTGWSEDVTQAITEDTTFIAQYKINDCSVLFLDWNGQTIKELSVEYGTTLNAEDIPTPTRAGYQFTGWDKVTTDVIRANTTFVAEYTQEARLIIKYPVVTGTSGLINQFYKTSIGEKVFTYVVGDTTQTTEYIDFVNDVLTPWYNDFENDGDYDYDVKFTGWDKVVPEYIYEDTTITAEYEKLLNVRLEYYSQLRFKTDDDGLYYATYIGYMKIERLVTSGTIINVDDFKRPDVDYEVYNASKGGFYNNLVNFEFLGWDKDITTAITEDTIIKGQYKMPTINVRMYDAEDYLFHDEDQDIAFLTIEDIISMIDAGSVWDSYRETLRNFLLFRWGEIGDQIADKLDFNRYVKNIGEYHNASTQILTGYVQLNTDNPDIYDGVFGSASAEVSEGDVLSYYSGMATENNLTYWINPIVFCNELYKLQCHVTYGTALDSAVKTMQNIWNSIMSVLEWLWNFITEWWWVIVLVVLAIYFRKPLMAFLTIAFKAIGNLFKKVGNKVKTASKKTKDLNKEHSKAKKENKKKGASKNVKKQK